MKKYYYYQPSTDSIEETTLPQNNSENCFEEVIELENWLGKSYKKGACSKGDIVVQKNVHYGESNPYQNDCGFLQDSDYEYRTATNKEKLRFEWLKSLCKFYFYDETTDSFKPAEFFSYEKAIFLFQRKLLFDSKELAKEYWDSRVAFVEQTNEDNKIYGYSIKHKDLVEITDYSLIPYSSWDKTFRHATRRELQNYFYRRNKIERDKKNGLSSYEMIKKRTDPISFEEVFFDFGKWLNDVGFKRLYKFGFEEFCGDGLIECFIKKSVNLFFIRTNHPTDTTWEISFIDEDNFKGGYKNIPKRVIATPESKEEAKQFLKFLDIKFKKN